MFVSGASAKYIKTHSQFLSFILAFSFRHDCVLFTVILLDRYSRTLNALSNKQKFRVFFSKEVSDQRSLWLDERAG